MEAFIFFKQFFKLSNQIGSLFPSSAALAKKIVFLPLVTKSARTVLEIGPGIGPITDAVVRSLEKRDSLVLVELNPEFCKVLEKKIRHWEKRKNCPHITLHQMNIFDFKSSKHFDQIICSLPLNSLGVTFVDALFKKIHPYLRKAGYFSFFEYLGLRSLGPTIAPTKKLRKRFNELNGFYKRQTYFQFETSKVVLKNFPPAVVYHLQHKS